MEQHEARGIDLAHLAEMAAGMKDLVHKEVVERMTTLYDMHELPYKSDIDKHMAYSVMETFYISIIFGWKRKSKSLKQTMARKAMFYTAYRNSGPAIQWFNESFGTIEEEEDVVSFASMLAKGQKLVELLKGFAQRDCSDISQNMAHIPNGGSNGRLRLSAFYLAGRSSHFDFKEKEEYLRDQGQLDETDVAHPAVIIPNYVLSRSNCMMQISSIFDLCCSAEECEGLTEQVEAAVGKALATPSGVAAVFRTLSTSATPARELPATLQNRLQEIADINEGSIPLHGRLFNQWMHHAFPLECPFPHARGTIIPMNREDWELLQGSSEATEVDISKRIKDDTCSVDSNGNVGCGAAASVNIPWSRQEEVLSLHDSSRDTNGSKGSKISMPTLVLCLSGALLAVLMKYFNKLRHMLRFHHKRAAKLEKI